MKIRFLTSVAGANFAYREKQVVDLRDDIAREFVRTGVAEPFVEKVERATLHVPESRRRALRA